MLLAPAADKGHVAVKRETLIEAIANQRESEKANRDARHQEHAIDRRIGFDELPFRGAEVVLSVGKRETAFHGPAAIALAFDLQKRELAVHVMTDPDLVTGPPVAPVGVIERAIGCVEIDAFVARPSMFT